MLYQMPFLRALIFLASALILIALTQWRRVHPFVAIVAVAAAFAYAVQLKATDISRVFGVGFSGMIYSPGLLIIAAGLVAAIARSSGASFRLMALIEGGRGARWIAAPLGLIAGLGASASAAFALLLPLLASIGGKSPAGRQSATITLALAISASHGLAVLSPVAIASISILGADWVRTGLFGVPLAILLIGIGAAFARPLSRAGIASPPEQEEPAEAPLPEAGTRWGVVVLLVATIVPLLMLMFQSIADIPTEPLGGEPGLETIVAIGRPLSLVLAGASIMIIGLPRQSLRLLADSAWTSRILGRIASVVLIVCAAGAFQALCQETGMAEAIGGRMLGWHVEALGGLAIAFLLAATLKTLQGSSLVAAITSAGMIQPLLAPLGLADPNAKALTALAIGIGAMTLSHVNDEYFWLVTTSGGFSPLRGVRTISLGTLVQGVAALAVLLACALLTGHS
jgi:gluconate:H+ symporter, GntP family